MEQKWTEKEFDLSDLGDERLKQRLIQISDSFSQYPESSINQSCKNTAKTKGAYRFFKNESVDPEKILSSHIKSTSSRCSDCETVLAIQDTTYFNYTSHKKTEGLSLISRKKGINQKELVTQGLIMHTTLAVSSLGLPLGILDQKIFSHEQRPKEKSNHNLLPIEDKESFRWLESLANTKEITKDQQIQVVTVCDREADMYDFFYLSKQIQSSVLVRANYNRTVNKSSTYSEKTGEKLWSLMNKQKVEGEIKVTVPKNKETPARIAFLEIKFSKFNLNPPLNHVSKKGEKPPILSLNAIYVKEKKPHEGVEAIEWMILTDLLISDFEGAEEKVKWYCLRWRIETFHKILKSGLKVEKCRLSTAERLKRYLTVMSIIAWRIFWITLVARVAPEASCLIFLNELEWKVLFLRINAKKKIPEIIPSIKECVIWIAQLGGFLARKGDGDPGIIYIWRGIKEFTNIIEGFKIAQRFVGNS